MTQCPECKGKGKIELFTSIDTCTKCNGWGKLPDGGFVAPRSGRDIPDEEIVIHRGDPVPGYPNKAHLSVEERAQLYGSAMQSEDRVHRVGQFQYTPRVIEMTREEIDEFHKYMKSLVSKRSCPPPEDETPF